MRKSRTKRNGFFSRFGIGRSRKQKSPASRSRSLRVESLELRQLLSVVWTGGGIDGKWSRGANWSTGLAPSGGETLVFSGSTKTGTTNDLTAGLSFASIEIASSNFTLAGTNIAIAAGGSVTVDSSASNTVISLAIALNGAVTFNIAGSGLSDSGIISGLGPLTKTGSNMLTLSAANTYTSGTTVSQGPLKAGNSLALGNANGPLAVSGGASVDLGSYSITVGGLTGAGTITNSGAIGSTLTDNSTCANDVFSGTLQNGGGSGSGSAGVLAFVKSGTGKLTLSGTNAHTGGTNITGGVLAASGTGNLGGGASGSSGPVTINGATLETSGNFTLSQGIGLLNSATVQVDSGTLSLTGVVSGTGSLTKTGSGTLCFGTAGSGSGSGSGGANTYSGPTTISGGVVQAACATAMGSGSAVTINAGTLEATAGFTLSKGITLGDASAKIQVDSGTVTATGVITGSGVLNKAGSGTLVLSGQNTYTGPTAITAGVLSVSNDGNLGAAPSTPTPAKLVINGGTLQATASFALNTNRGIALGPATGSGSGTIDVASNQALTYAGIIANNSAGAGSLIKTSSGVLLVTGANTYTGATNINAGQVCVNTSLASAVTVAGGTLSGTGTTGVISATSGWITPGGQVTVGALTTTGNLSLSGTGTNFNVDLANNGADLVRVSGTVTITNSAHLNVSATNLTSTDQGEVFLLIENDGASAVSGTLFYNQPEGSALNLNGVPFFVTYCYNHVTGSFGTGHDVALVVSKPPTAAPDAYCTLENQPTNNPGNNVLANDSDINRTRTLSVDRVSVTVSGSTATTTINPGGVATLNTSKGGSLTMHSTGSFSYTPRANFLGNDGDNLASNENTYTAYDGLYDSSPATLQFVVSAAPIAATGKSIQWPEGDGTFDLATFTQLGTADPNHYTAVINWGDGTPPCGGSIRSDGNGGFIVYGEHNYVDNAAAPFTISITVNDTQSGSTQTAPVTSSAHVYNVPPTATLDGPIAAAINNPTLFSLVNPCDPSSVDTAAGFQYCFATSQSGLSSATPGTSCGQWFTFSSLGPVTVWGRIIDKDGGYTDYSMSVTVMNQLYWAVNNPTTTDFASGVWHVGAINGSSISGWVPGCSAIFPTGTTSVIVSGQINVVSIDFQSDGAVLRPSRRGDELILGGSITVDSPGAVNTIAVNIASGSLTKLGSGRLIVAGSNTYAGDTVISAGTLQAGADDTLPLGALAGNVHIATGTAFDLAGHKVDVNGLDDAPGGAGGTIADSVGGGTLIVGNSNASAAFSGAFAGGLLLVKAGSGTLTLSGDNSGFAGPTTVQAGTLDLENHLGGALNVASGAVVTGPYSLSYLSMANLPPANVDEVGTQISLSAGIRGQATGDTIAYTWQVTAPNGQPLLGGNGAAYCFTPSNVGNYVILVSAVDQTALGKFIYPMSQTIRVLGTPPAPTVFTTTLISDSEIDLAWAADSTDLAGFQFEQFNNQTSTWSQPTSVPVTSRDWVVTGAFPADNNYGFRIQAVNITGGISAATTLIVLDGLQLTATSDTQVNASWTPLTSATNYTLQRSDDGGDCWTAVHNGPQASFSDTGLSEGTDYEYRLAAQLSDSTQALSPLTTVTTLPAVPSNLAATYISGDEINVAWQNNSLTAGGFQLRKSSDGTTWTNAGNVDSGETNYVVSGPFSPSATWQFEVQAIGDSGSSAWSPPVSIAVPVALPAAPTGLTAVVNSAYQITLTWSDSTNATGYIVERQDGGTGTWQQIATPATTGYVDTSVQPETAYSYRIVATNANGGSMPSTAASATSALLAPTDVTATVISGDQIEVSWSVESTAGSGFRVVESTSGAGDPSTWATVGSPSAETTSSVISDTFADLQTYYFAVCKVGVGGTASAFSTAASVQVPNLPAAPGNLTATVVAASGNSPEHINLSWQDTNSALASYSVQRSSNNGTTWVTIATLPAGSSSYEDDGIIVGLTYEYRLIATNSAGESAAVPSNGGSGSDTAEGVLPPTDLQVIWAGPSTNFTWSSNMGLSWTNQNADVSSTVIQWTRPTDATPWNHSVTIDGGDEESSLWNGPDSMAPGLWQFRVRTVINDGSHSDWVTQSYTVPCFPPVAHDDTFDVSHGEQTTLDVVFLDATDPQSWDGMTLGIATAPSRSAHGSLSISSDRQALLYTSDPGYRGIDTFQYTVTNGHTVSRPATVTLNVTQSLTDEEVADAAVVLPNSTYCGTLFDPHSESLVSFGQAQHGSVEVNVDGSFSYHANSTYRGMDSFSFTLEGPSGNVEGRANFDVENTVLNFNSTNDNGGLGNGSTYLWNDSGYGLCAFGYGVGTSDRNVADWKSPGGIVPVDDGLNSDGIPGFAGGYGLYGNSDWSDEWTQLIPLEVNLPSRFNRTAGRIQVTYSASDPAKVTRSGSGTTEEPYQYALPQDGGALRIWTGPMYDGTGPRTWESISNCSDDPSTWDLGYYLPSGAYDAADEGFSDLDWLGFIPLYIERVRPSLNGSENTITISLDPDGSGNWSPPETVYVADPPMLDSDTMNASSGLPDRAQDGNPSWSLEEFSQRLESHGSPNSSMLQPGKIIVVNDKLIDGVPAFVDFGGATGSSQFVPLVVKLPQNTDLAKAMLQFDYDGSDPSNIQVDGDGPDKSYLPAPGTLRLWTEDGNDARDPADITAANPGDYITPNTAFPASLLQWRTIPNSTDEEAVVFVEAIRASTYPIGQSGLGLTVDVNGTGNFIGGGSASFTMVQDTVPDHSVSHYAGVAQGADGGRPMSQAFSGAVRLSDGILNYGTTDFSVPGTGFPRTVSRVWTDQPGLVVNPSFGNGQIMTQLPYLIQATGSIIAVIDGQPYYFDRMSSNAYKERFFGLEDLTYDSSNDQYQFADTTGTKIVFNGFKYQDYSDPSVGMYKRGAMLSVTDSNNNAVTATAWDDLGNTTQVAEGSDVFTYVYTPNGYHAERLSEVSLQRQGQTIAKADYTYYTTNDRNGAQDDLKQVKVSTSGNCGSLVQEIGGSYYRYYYDYHALLPSDLTYAATGPAYARLMADSGGFPDGVADLSAYADFFAYGGDCNSVVTQDIVGAGASSIDAPSAVEEFTYDYDNDGQSRGAGINAWNQKTTVTLPHNSQLDDDHVNTLTVYTNYAGELMLSDFCDKYDPVSPILTDDRWDTFNAFDAQGRIVLTAHPSTQMQPDDSKPDLLDKQSDGTYRLMSKDQGLIEGNIYSDTTNLAKGDVAGYLSATYLQNGQANTIVVPQSMFRYRSQTAQGITIYPVRDSIVFSQSVNGITTGSRDTHYDYVFGPGESLHVSRITETLPAVGTSQNALSDPGRTITGTIVANYDSRGRVHDVTDADGYTTTYAYDDATGGITKTTIDLGNGNQIITTAQYDALGRPTEIIDGNGTFKAFGYSDSLSQSTTVTTSFGPTHEVTIDRAHGTITTKTTVPDGSLQTVSEDWLDYAGRTVKSTRYDGKDHTYTALDKYDDSGRLYWTQDAAGTITKTDYDGLGRATAVSVGTSDSNLAKVESMRYDDNGVGDGNLTERDQGTDSATMYYDWRDRLVAQRNGLQTTLLTLDNLGEVTQTDVYDSRLPGTYITFSNGAAVPPPVAARRAETKTDYDNQGRAYAVHVYSVDPASGVVTSGNSLRTDYCHDGRGYVVRTKSPGGLVSQTQYDGAGRVTCQSSGSNSTVLESVTRQYDAAGNPILVATSQSNGTTTRTSYVANWYDAANRLMATADCGINGNTPLTRPATPPARNPLAGPLVTSFEYDYGGFLNKTTAPNGLATTLVNDNLGRVREKVENPVTGGNAPDQNRTTKLRYDAVDRVIGEMVSNRLPDGTSKPAFTHYDYGVSTDQESAINSNNLLRKIAYPDGTTETFTYNARGEVIEKTDRNLVKHAYAYDPLGHVTSDTVTDFGSANVDKTICKLGTQYDALGNAILLTSYTKETDGSPVAANEVKRAFDGLGELTAEYVNPIGAVDDGTPAAVQYHYDISPEAAGNYSRQDSLTYPDGTQVAYTYTGTDASISRVSSVTSGRATLESYQYLGLTTVTAWSDSNPVILADWACGVV
jgi:autotransporter-associated beta strand protein/YD repeat-containing protein